MALVHAAVIVRDIENSDGDVLQILTAVPAEAAFERAVQVGRVVILKLVNLGGGEKNTIRLDCHVNSPIVGSHHALDNIAGTYMSPIWRDAIFFGRHVVPIHTCFCFDFLPSQAGNAGQLHGSPQHSFGIRRDVDTYWPAHLD